MKSQPGFRIQPFHRKQHRCALLITAMQCHLRWCVLVQMRMIFVGDCRNRLSAADMIRNKVCAALASSVCMRYPVCFFGQADCCRRASSSLPPRCPSLQSFLCCFLGIFPTAIPSKFCPSHFVYSYRAPPASLCPPLPPPCSTPRGCPSPPPSPKSSAQTLQTISQT
jgi:hypothetical protein